jgi:hypothetical protein
MHWPRTFNLFQVLGALGIAVVPPVVLGIILRAEGNWFLPLFGDLLSLGFLLASKVGGPDGPKRRLFFMLGLTVNVLGTLTLMILLNVSRRSLAEAWLSLVRSGQGRGFFSFFATLLYGLFCGYSAILWVFKGFMGGLLAFFSITALTLGILYNQPLGYFLALTVGSIAVLYILSQDIGVPDSGDRRGLFKKKISGPLESLSFPLVVSVVLSVPFFFSSGGGFPISLSRFFDFTPLVLDYAPSLPLLLDVPGYGTGLGSASIPPKVLLSDLPLFRVQGRGPGRLYLQTGFGQSFTGHGWQTNDGFKGSSIIEEGNVDPRTRNGLSEVTITAVSDYDDTIPLPEGATAVILPPSVPPVVDATPQEGIRFRSPLSKGDWIIVYYKDGIPIVPGKVLDYLAGGPDPSGKIQELADRLGQGKTPSEKVNTLMEYLGANFRYRTETRGGDPSGVMERFLFDEKEGFCLHFAGAFVILARRMGIPALLVEGYRVNLDDRGQGIVRGTDSHAWAQIYVDGRWRRMDPTPPASPSTPTVDPVSTVLGDVKKIGVSIDISWLCIILGTAILGGSVFLIRWVIFEHSEAAQLRRRARRMVREGLRRGVRGPEVLGWLGWSRTMAQKVDPETAKKIGEVASAMVSLAFDPESRVQKKGDT